MFHSHHSFIWKMEVEEHKKQGLKHHRASDDLEDDRKCKKRKTGKHHQVVLLLTTTHDALQDMVTYLPNKVPEHLANAVKQLLQQPGIFPPSRNRINVFGWKDVPRDEVIVTAHPDQVRYNFSGYDVAKVLEGSTMKAMREWVQQLVQDRTGDATIYNMVLCNRYLRHEDSVSWHADDEPEIAHRTKCIVSVSLGFTRTFQIKAKVKTKAKIKKDEDKKAPEEDNDDDQTTTTIYQVDLQDRDVLIMHPGMQDHFVHCVPRRVTPKRLPLGADTVRWNLTYRVYQ